LARKTKKKTQHTKSTARIGFIGGGNIAEAIIRGLIHTKSATPANIFVANRGSKKLSALKRKYGIQTVSQNLDILQKTNIIFLCVKPQSLREVTNEIFTGVNKKQLWVSVAAGVTTQSLEAMLGPEARVIRAMPNTPLLIGKGATGICAGSKARAGDLRQIKALFDAVGFSVIVKNEEWMAIITALSGSGPAYVFYFIEALIAQAVCEGLPEKTAKDLAIETLLGAASLLKEQQKTPEELRRNVTSPGGTTVEGIKALEEGLFPQVVGSAINAATRRAKELAASF